MHYEDYYAALGKLLYSLASVDGVITNAERDKLKEIVNRELLPADQQKDEYGSDLAHYTEMEFDYLDEEMSDPEVALESFIEFVEKHYNEWDDRMIDACVGLMEELAAAFYGTSRSEREMIERIKRKFDSLELKELRKKVEKNS